MFWANQGFLLAAEHTGGTTGYVVRINYFFSYSSSAFAKRTGSLSLIIIVSQIIFLTT